MSSAANTIHLQFRTTVRKQLHETINGNILRRVDFISNEANNHIRVEVTVRDLIRVVKIVADK